MDLGLPSGILWATMNVGASKPSESGQYFQWGDTSGYTAAQVGTGEGKKKFASDFSDYKFAEDGYMTKYEYPSAVLELEDDAAHVNMGGDWHMPTYEQLYELKKNTTSAWTTSNDNVSGIVYTSKKDSSKSIFIPASGYASEGTVNNIGSKCCVWSSSLTEQLEGYNIALSINSTSSTDDAWSSRDLGLPVRGVIG